MTFCNHASRGIHPPYCWWQRLACGVLGIALAGGKLLAADGNPAANLTAAPPVTAMSPLNNLMPEGVLAWDGLTKETNVVAVAGPAHFVFNFTNRTPGPVIIKDLQPACGCTTAQSPPLPWIIPAGGHGQFGLTINLWGKARRQIKTACVMSDHGYQEVTAIINILPPPVSPRSSAGLANDLARARMDRQAIFRGDCVICHVKPGEDKDGRELYYAVCAICHEGRNHSPTVPDLFAIQTPTNVVFWLNGIRQGKPGSLMPAFSIGAGGSLSDEQIVSLARFLNTADSLEP